jgi:hypothetical protein
MRSLAAPTSLIRRTAIQLSNAQVRTSFSSLTLLSQPPPLLLQLLLLCRDNIATGVAAYSAARVLLLWLFKAFGLRTCGSDLRTQPT